MLKADIAGLFFQAVVEEARVAGLLSDEHFSVEGTLIEAWASQKSFQRKDSNGKPGDSGNGGVDFHGEQRTDQTHESKTDPDARLYKKGTGKEAKLCYAGHVLKLVAYQIEGDLLDLIRHQYARTEDEGRTLIQTALLSAAALEPTKDELRITLSPLSSPHRSQVAATQFETLNKTETVFPGTELRMRFAVAGFSN